MIFYLPKTHLAAGGNAKFLRGEYKFGRILWKHFSSLKRLKQWNYSPERKVAAKIKQNVCQTQSVLFSLSMSSMSLNFVIVTFFAFILLANGNPIDSLEGNDIILCSEGASSGRKRWKKLLDKFSLFWAESKQTFPPLIVISFLLSRRLVLQWLMVCSSIQTRIDAEISVGCVWRVISAEVSSPPRDCARVTRNTASSVALNVSRVFAVTSITDHIFLLFSVEPQYMPCHLPWKWIWWVCLASTAVIFPIKYCN